MASSLYVFKPLLFITVLLAGATVYLRHYTSTIEHSSLKGLEYLEDSIYGNGTRLRVLTRGSETDGQYYSVEYLIRPGVSGFYSGQSGSPPAHIHPSQEEVFVVKKGLLGYQLDGKEGFIEEGDQLRVPAGTSHYFFNGENSTDLVFESTLSPAGVGEIFLETLQGLGQTYQSLDRIHPLQVLVLYHEAGVMMDVLPKFLTPVVDKALVPFAHFLGFRGLYPEYYSSAGEKVVDEVAAAPATPAVVETDTEPTVDPPSDEETDVELPLESAVEAAPADPVADGLDGADVVVDTPAEPVVDTPADVEIVEGAHDEL